jgi:hypothetical protein
LTSDPRGDDVAARKVEAPATTERSGTATGTERATGDAIAADAHVDVARTDTRRAEEATEKAHQAAEDARKAEEDARKAEERAREDEERARRQAAEAAERNQEVGPAAGVSRTAPPISQQGDPIVFGPFTAEKPELLVAAAFVGAFVLARILKAITT